MINKNYIIYVVIATSLNRTDMLIDRALFSIYNQKNINSNNIKIIIVDDNVNDNEINNIRNSVKNLRKKLNIESEKFFTTQVIKNVKRRYYSGTGSWNTAIELINSRKNENVYIAILDDDDYYSDEYFNEILYELNNQSDLIAIFSPITWEHEKYNETFFLTINDLTQRNFFIKNPGIQGSNMFFKSHVLKEIGGFDENLMSATDRDLMIRFIDYIQRESLHSKIKILNTSFVFYNATNPNSITNSKIKKHLGLDIFYAKYKNRFSDYDFQLSLNRAKKLFDYEYK
jgi:hypothetical protein